ncbi:hypothetical protein NPIL_123881, partial [Nephila pilipes]
MNLKCPNHDAVFLRSGAFYNCGRIGPVSPSTPNSYVANIIGEKE